MTDKKLNLEMTPDEVENICAELIDLRRKYASVLRERDALQQDHTALLMELGEARKELRYMRGIEDWPVPKKQKSEQEKKDKV